MAATVPLKIHLPELFQQKNKENIRGGFNYSRRLLHTYACFSFLKPEKLERLDSVRLDLTIHQIDLIGFYMRIILAILFTKRARLN